MAKMTEAQKAQKVREQNIKKAKALYSKTNKKTGERVHSVRGVAEAMGFAKSTVFNWIKH